ncbi:hypothetical protein JCM16161A_11560 [Vulcanisaeta sp. JCM 16161]|uniref:hypothetical protein n=1 Tax=Vulcanisaeta sp. JCM 16161 TaxID=1295372 RepID=UPI0006CFDC13|nr:hypothetical protein [Vulcanisaeta sp. JCM 16161]
MNLESIVKYANAAYAGLMIGLAAYFVILIRHGYTFVPSSSISVDQLFSSGALGPLMLGVVPWIIMVMIIATIFIVLINMAYENSLKPKKVGKEVAKRREERRKGRK